MFKLNYTFISSRHLLHSERFFANSDVSVSSIMNRIYLCIIGIIILLLDINILEIISESCSMFSNCSSNISTVSNYSDIFTIIFVLYFIFTIFCHTSEQSIKFISIMLSAFSISIFRNFSMMPIFYKYLINLSSTYRLNFYILLKCAICISIVICSFYYLIFILIKTSEFHVIHHYFNSSLTYGGVYCGRTYSATMYRLMILSYTNELIGFNNFSPLDLSTNSIVIYIYLFIIFIKNILYLLSIISIYLYFMYSNLSRNRGIFKFWDIFNIGVFLNYIWVRFFDSLLHNLYLFKFFNSIFMFICIIILYLCAFNFQLVCSVYNLYLVSIVYCSSVVAELSFYNIIFDFSYMVDVCSLYTCNILGNFVSSKVWPFLGPNGAINYKALQYSSLAELLPRTSIYTHIDFYEVDCAYNSIFRFIKCMVGVSGTYITYGFGSFIFDNNLWPLVRSQVGFGLYNLVIGDGTYIFKVIYGSSSRYYFFDSLNIWYDLNISGLLNRDPIFGDNKYSWCHDLWTINNGKSSCSYKLHEF